MSVFDKIKDIADDIILTEYEYVWSYNDREYVLASKNFTNGYRKVFYPVEVIWKHYTREAYSDIKYTYGYNIQVDKKFFVQYVINYKNIDKLIYKNKEYYKISILRPLFDSFNKRVVKEYLKREEEQQKTKFRIL